jgi:hypothetical protein
MAIVELSKGRAIVERDGETLRVTFPAPAQGGGIVLMCVWLTGWAVGEFLVGRQFLSGEAFQESSGHDLKRLLFLIAWFAGWTVVGAVLIYTLIWQLFGKEVIELKSTSLKHLKQVLFFSRNREYALANIANVRLAPPEPKYIRGKYVIATQSFASGAIAFDYGRTTHRLAQGLDEAEAQYVIGELRKRIHGEEDEAN